MGRLEVDRRAEVLFGALEQRRGLPWIRGEVTEPALVAQCSLQLERVGALRTEPQRPLGTRKTRVVIPRGSRRIGREARLAERYLSAQHGGISPAGIARF